MMTPNSLSSLVLAFVAIGTLAGELANGAEPVELWLTDPGGPARFERQTPLVPSSGAAPGDPTIEVEPAKTYQAIDGFGFTLTGGSAQHLMRMTAPARAALLRELFATDSTNIGVSYLRVSIGASDLNERVFSYDDLPAGQTDPDLTRFSLAPDRADVIPVLKQILAIQPTLKIMGSPWSAPVWMKDNQDSRGGSLKREWYEAYARYLVKYVQGMKAEASRSTPSRCRMSRCTRATIPACSCQR